MTLAMHVEARPAQRPRRERPERRRRLGRDPRRERLQARERRSRAPYSSASACGSSVRWTARRSSASLQRLAHDRHVLVRRDRHEAGAVEHRHASRGSSRSASSSSGVRRSTGKRPRARCRAAARLASPAASSARATPCRRCSGATTKHTIAAASCGGTGKGGSADAHARARVAQLGVRLRVHPADDRHPPHRRDSLPSRRSRCAPPSRAVHRARRILPRRARSAPGSSGNSTSPTRGCRRRPGRARGRRSEVVVGARGRQPLDAKSIRDDATCAHRARMHRHGPPKAPVRPLGGQRRDAVAASVGAVTLPALISGPQLVAQPPLRGRQVLQLLELRLHRPWSGKIAGLPSGARA